MSLPKIGTVDRPLVEASPDSLTRLLMHQVVAGDG